jgi:branched-chain amino acid transport system permease protein
VITLGLSVIFENGVLLVLGAKWRGIPYYIKGQITLLGINFNFQSVVILIASILIMTTFWALLKFTMIGKALRATAQNKEAASLYGINVKRVYSLIYGLSCSLIAIAGGLLAPILYIYPTVGGHPFLLSFVIVIIGGLGSLKGSIFSGFLVGVLRSISITVFSAEWADIILFIITIIMLTVRPTGLFGRRD